MSTYRLKNLLSPRSVALVGASPRRGSVGRAIVQNILDAKFKGEFGLVNPHYAEIAGVATVGNLGKLPLVPELVVITAPAAAIAGIIDEAGNRRGRPSVNATWDNTVAILTGDYLFARASEISTELGTEVSRLLARTIATLCDGSADFLTRPSGWPETRYEAKARKLGHEVWYFRYRRTDPA